nr:hypothetical protein [Burkholderia sp. BCC1993]
MRELNSGDIFVDGSDRYDDPANIRGVWDEFREELPRYRELVDFAVHGRAFVHKLKDELSAVANKVDAGSRKTTTLRLARRVSYSTDSTRIPTLPTGP